MVHGDGELTGGCLRETPAGIGSSRGGEVSVVLASRTDPATEPLSCQLGLCGTEFPGAAPDEDVGPESAALLDGTREGVRTEQSSPVAHTALVGVESIAHAAIQAVRWGQLDVPHHRKSEQHWTA